MKPAGDIKDVKALLIAQLDSLVRRLAPEGRRSGAYWLCRSKAHGEKIGGMFVWMTGAAAGGWRDAVTGDKGDVLHLIQYREELADMRAALAWARDWLGIAKLPDAERLQRVQRANAQREKAARDDAVRLEKARRTALAIYLDARKQPWRGSPADRYLKGRGIDFEALGRRPGCLGWLPDAEHIETGTRWPVLVAGISGPDGRIIAVHRTWLKPDGSGKAPVDPERKVWPAYQGGAIRLWRGESKLSVEDAAKNGLRETLVLGEGVEDAGSCVMARPELRTWAAVSLPNLAAIALPGCIDEVIVCRDNDWAKPQAARLFDKACASFARQGAKVRVAVSHVGKDVNNALMGTA